MVEAWIKFTNGEARWESFNNKQRWMIISGKGVVLKAREEGIGRGYELWDSLHEKGLVPEFSGLSDGLCIRRQEIFEEIVRTVQ